MTGRDYDEKLAHLHREARRIFSQALDRASIPAAFDSHFRLAGRKLIHQGDAGGGPGVLALDDYQKIYVIALGKAALPMLDALLESLPGGLPLAGVCAAPALPRLRNEKVLYYAGGHPFPNADSFRAAYSALRLAQSADKDTLVFFLISGGGSALCEAPLDKRITLEDTVAFHRVLVGAGATIREINTIRKHFSAVKGGRLALAAAEAAKFSLLVSDVPLNHLDALASAPTLPDSSTVEECREILARYHLLEQFPAGVQRFFSDPDLPETPGRKHLRHSSGAGRALIDGHEETMLPREETFPIASRALNAFPPDIVNSHWELLLSSGNLVRAAAEAAHALGFEVVIDNTCDDWDYRDAAQYLLARFGQLRREYPRLCLLSGGEITVRLEKEAGAGGRNQQFALACALELAGCRLLEPSHGGLPAGVEPRTSSPDSPLPDFPLVVLSAGSDGVDGSSPAAGAIADPTTVARARNRGFDAGRSLHSFDAYPVFRALDNCVVTGPTNNNLRDLRIVLGCS